MKNFLYVSETLIPFLGDAPTKLDKKDYKTNKITAIINLQDMTSYNPDGEVDIWTKIEKTK